MSLVTSTSVNKLHFKVVGCTSWEDSYHPKSIEEINPYVKGWRSERYCLYPQQVVVCLKAPVRLRKIQLLSHEYMISSKIELFVANTPNSLQDTSHLNTIPYRRLGYVSLSENVATEYKSREMKSINVDVEGRYLKIVFHTNHVNQLNLYSQVSVLALNLLGHDTRFHSIQSQSSNSTAKQQQSPVHVSVTNDLSFDMTLDPSSAHLVKELELRKVKAIEDDQFELAKLLKGAVDVITKTGKFLCHYEKEKRQAIAREDYDEAKKWKVQKDKLQYETNQRLHIDSLLRGEVPIQSRILEGGILPKHYTSKEKLEQSMGQTLPPLQSKPQILEESVPLIESGFHQVLEGQLPQINVSQPLSEYPDKEHGDVASLCQPEPLTDAQLNEAAIAVQVLSNHTVSKVFSKQYNLREQGLTDVLVILKEGSTTFSKSEMTKAMCQILKKGLGDKVLTSFMIAVDILKTLVGPYARQHRLSEGELFSILDKVLPVLMSRLADPNTRIQSTTVKAILDLSTAEELKPLLGLFMLRPFAQDKTKNLEDGSKVTISMESQARAVTWRYAKGRIELLQSFLQTVDKDTARVTLPKIMEFVNVCLQHIHPKVRESAAQLTIELYKQYLYDRTAIRELLPVSSNDHIEMKNIFWRSLFEHFDEIDGGIVSEQNSFEKAKKSKQKKIDSLKNQLDVLRGLAHQINKHDQTIIEKPTEVNSEQMATDQSTSRIDSNALDQTCPFCKESRPELQNQMDTHFATNCPMLAQCKRCSQVVEIKSLGSHMLNECDQKSEMTECPKCHEVLLKNQLESHMKASRCTAPPDNCVKCPLCHTNVQNSDKDWLTHLTSISSGCAKNPRRKRRRGQQQLSTVDKSSTLTEGATIIPR